MRKVKKLALNRETLVDLSHPAIAGMAGMMEYAIKRPTIDNTVYSGQVGCAPVSATCQSNCAGCPV